MKPANKLVAIHFLTAQMLTSWTEQAVVHYHLKVKAQEAGR